MLEVSAFNMTFGSTLWWSIFFAVLFFFIIYSAVLVYHWFVFALNNRMAISVSILYFLISSVLLITMLGSTIQLVTL